MGTAHDGGTENEDGLRPDESLPPFVAYQVQEETIQKAPMSSGSAGERYRHGKVEAETRRISEEVTREAQRRVRAAQAATESAEAASATPAATSALPLKTILAAPMPLRRFFVPLDGTLLGERALPYALTLAQLVQADMLLGHITPINSPAILGELLRPEDSARQKAQQSFAPEALPYLRQVQERIAAFNIPHVDTVHITASTITDGLLTIEQTRDIDLVALALRTRRESDHMMLGKVVDSVIRLGPAPALVIPPQADAEARPFAIRHVLVPLDGSPLAEEALGPLGGLLRQAQGRLSERIIVTLLGVSEDESILPDYQSYLDTMRDALLAQSAWAEAQIYAEAIVGSPPGAIVGAVEHGTVTRSHNDDDRGPVDMLIMSTHGLGGIRRRLFGSVATYIVPRVRVPVLLVHSDRLTEQEQ